jgi:aspartyl-tRNA synthetase
MFHSVGDKYKALHHPFTSPKVNNNYKLKFNIKEILSRSYDIVINGSEIGGGSIRIHDKKIQSIVLSFLGFNYETMYKSFGFLLNALQYGAPIHGGLALGLDRLLMTIFDTANIRDVIAFPKTQSANCLMTGAPSKVSNV